jgi:hypothetical protein
MGRDDEHFYVFFGRLVFFLRKSSVAHFFIGSLIFGQCFILSSLCILVISPLSGG